MGTFVTGNTALPTPKVDASPPQGKPGELDAADINNLWNAIADLRAGILGPDAIYKASALGAVARSIFAKLGDVLGLNDFGIGDPSATINILENGRVSQLPWVEPYVWFKMDAFTGARDVTALVGERQEPVAITRASVGEVVVGGVATSAAAGQLRFPDNPTGLLIELGRTQFISVPDAPVNQTGLALAVASYYLRVEGTGSITVTLTTGTATGLPLTVTASTPGGFAISVAATVDITVTGSVTFAQLENWSSPTSRIHTASARASDSVSMANLLRSGRDWIVSFRAQPYGGLPWAGQGDRGLFTIGDATNIANIAYAYFTSADGKFHFIINDAANASRVVTPSTVFLGTSEHEVWFYGSSDGKMEIWVDGSPVSPLGITGTGTGFITTMPANIHPGAWYPTFFFNGVFRDFKVYFDVSPERLPKPNWTRTIAANTVACLGDSITAGSSGGITTTYPSTLQTTLSAGSTGAWTVTNAGTAGDQTFQSVQRWGSGLRRQSHKYIVFLSGINDVNAGIPAAVMWNHTVAFINQARSDGKTVVLVTVLPGTATTIHNAERLALNVLIRAYCAAGGAILVDASPDFDNGDGRTLLLAYDSGDHLHPNQAGANHLAALVAAAIPH